MGHPGSGVLREGCEGCQQLKLSTNAGLGGFFKYFWNFHPENWGRFPF